MVTNSDVDILNITVGWIEQRERTPWSCEQSFAALERAIKCVKVKLQGYNSNFETISSVREDDEPGVKNAIILRVNREVRYDLKLEVNIHWKFC